MNQFERHTHQGTEVDGSGKISHGDLLYYPPSYGQITSITRPSTTTLTIAAGCQIVIGGVCLYNPADVTVTRYRSTVSEKEYLYAYRKADGTLGFVLSVTIPIFSTASGYWVEDGDTSKRYIMAWGKDGSGNFYIGDCRGVGANNIHLLFNTHRAIINGATVYNGAYQLSDQSGYMYGNGIVLSIDMVFIGRPASGTMFLIFCYQDNSGNGEFAQIEEYTSSAQNARVTCRVGSQQPNIYVLNMSSVNITLYTFLLGYTARF